MTKLRAMSDVAVSARAHARSIPYRSDIEGLRGIAVLIVVAFHCGLTTFSGGFVGVDVFFVLSGYLITGLLVAEIENKGRLDLVQFYARRVRRLLPAAALTLVGILAISGFLFAPGELVFASRAARATSIYLSNVFFAINASDYFAADVETNPLLHTWSLAVEEQFYLFWPVMILMTMRAGGSRRALVSTLWVTTVVSLAGCVWYSLHATTVAFYSLPTRAWEFSAGGLAAVQTAPRFLSRDSAWSGAGWLGIGTILGSAVLITPQMVFPGLVVLAPVVGTLLSLVAGAAGGANGSRVVLDSVPLQFLGRLSYSWYLCHWPFLVFAAVLFPEISPLGKVAAAAGALVVATVTHRFVENPIRFSPYFVARPLLSVGLGACLTIGMVTASFSSMAFARRLAASTEMQPISAAVADISRLPPAKCVSLSTTTDVKTCVFGDQQSATNLVLFGDSHAIQWFNPLEKVAVENKWRLTTVVKSGCPAADVRPASSNVSQDDACVRWRRNALAMIIAARPSLVLLGSATVYLGQKGRVRESTVALETWGAGTRRTVETLVSVGLQVALMRDTPLLSFDVPTCVARRRRHAWFSADSCDTAIAGALHPEVSPLEERSVSGLQNVRFIDLTPSICPDGVCRAEQNGTITYRDDNHVTGTFADSLAATLQQKLLSVLSPARP